MLFEVCKMVEDALTLGELQAIRDKADAASGAGEGASDFVGEGAYCATDEGMSDGAGEGESDGVGGLRSVLIPTESAFYDCPRVCVRPEADKLLKNGNAIRPQEIGKKEASGDTKREQSAAQKSHADGRVRMCTSDGMFLGLYEFSKTTGRYEPVKMFFS